MLELKKHISLEFEIIPGISSIQILSARHKISLSKIAGSVILTTPRGLKKIKDLKRQHSCAS